MHNFFEIPETKHLAKICAFSKFQLKIPALSFKRQQVAGETERKWEHRCNREAVCLCTFLEAIALLAGCPVSRPSSMCLCLGFLSSSLPLQIFSNATEECSNVVEAVKRLYSTSRIFFLLPIWQIKCQDSLFLPWCNTHMPHHAKRLYSSCKMYTCK